MRRVVGAVLCVVLMVSVGGCARLDSEVSGERSEANQSFKGEVVFRMKGEDGNYESHMIVLQSAGDDSTIMRVAYKAAYVENTQSINRADLELYKYEGRFGGDELERLEPIYYVPSRDS